jgi:hypothetical protein
MTRMASVRRASFVVRVVQSKVGQVSGVIERVARGAMEAFTDMNAVRRAITRMLQGAGTLPEVASDTLPPRRERPHLGERSRSKSVRTSGPT